ncbi:RNA-protein complex protein Nop10 [Candidatus Bathyarchaeota archaeon]|nr:RNA-protein complex protein Nop10 [Candidatus Bathyarchaeota archaeon]PDM26644.1 MAG: ribosome biogenesis protein [Candidatus Bathyarchaeota archaeon B24-2]RJS83751.1 MAG: RNA-protein complex protein Nop10 [Candidatus Bathyarchaeota archaeon]RLG96370.1 MAG: RNA-protein complex protein Nop10 [Candidatus Bathyarchaeota archaeon]RLI23106.1 MAG: RNA-protein complex protein Nop10 [Candidatus Bathyarchaeota archaeon]
MVWLMRKCVECGRYTLNKDKCPICGGKVRIPHPPKFSPDDKYLKYRLAMKDWKKR